MKLFPLTSSTTDELRILVILVFYRNSSVSILYTDNTVAKVGACVVVSVWSESEVAPIIEGADYDNSLSYSEYDEAEAASG